MKKISKCVVLLKQLFKSYSSTGFDGNLHLKMKPAIKTFIGHTNQWIWLCLLAVKYVYKLVSYSSNRLQHEESSLLKSSATKTCEILLTKIVKFLSFVGSFQQLKGRISDNSIVKLIITSHPKFAKAGGQHGTMVGLLAARPNCLGVRFLAFLNFFSGGKIVDVAEVYQWHC